VDTIWLIPDQTVISETIIEFIMKTSLIHRTPVVGYNRFFYTSGASLSFVFNYYQLGRQSGKQAVRLLHGKSCTQQVPEFEIWLNQRVYRQLGLPLPQKLPPEFKAQP